MVVAVCLPWVWNIYNAATREREGEMGRRHPDKKLTDINAMRTCFLRVCYGSQNRGPRRWAELCSEEGYCTWWISGWKTRVATNSCYCFYNFDDHLEQVITVSAADPKGALVDKSILEFVFVQSNRRVQPPLSSSHKQIEHGYASQAETVEFLNSRANRHSSGILSVIVLAHNP